MTSSEIERVNCRVCTAILTLNRSELEWALAQREILHPELLDAVQEAMVSAPVPEESRLVGFTAYFPAWLQYIGQRVILLSPSLARRILRGTGLHHQLF